MSKFRNVIISNDVNFEIAKHQPDIRYLYVDINQILFLSTSLSLSLSLICL